MCSALNDLNFAVLNAANNTIALVYMPIPISLHISVKRFWFSNSGIAVSINVFKLPYQDQIAQVILALVFNTTAQANVHVGI